MIRTKEIEREEGRILKVDIDTDKWTISFNGFVFDGLVALSTDTHSPKPVSDLDYAAEWYRKVKYDIEDLGTMPILDCALIGPILGKTVFARMNYTTHRLSIAGSPYFEPLFWRLEQASNPKAADLIGEALRAYKENKPQPKGDQAQCVKKS